ncbi:hypothetical protein LBW89_20460 [Paenibacillus sp. alder61]|uniref:hypothetical protein n=1 Tax=Paenibacillus sp. alder61 TaxID=2862948 RepID=UPI001CD5165A|nr:hypothetical protein [Paenibacillus sp. alder61]MCA1295384.1 hypothetical protein [Paenibacillus sp. alder61]
MHDFSLVQEFSMISLNAQRSRHMTTAKKVALRCMAAAVILEAYMEGFMTGPEDQLGVSKEIQATFSSVPYREVFFQDSNFANKRGSLGAWLKRASRLSKRKLSRLETVVSASLLQIGLLEEIPHLMGCDLYFHSAGLSIKEYRCHMQMYPRITERCRAEILEEGAVDEKTICMLWLLRESGCMHDLFSRNELERVAVRMNELHKNNPLARQVYPIRIRHGWELAVKRLLRAKTQFVKTPVGSGVNFIFPIMERAQSVFIETEAWFSNPQERLNDVTRRLESNGHSYTILRTGPIPTLKIDNVEYEAVPQAIYGRVPIHGVRLLPKRSI